MAKLKQEILTIYQEIIQLIKWDLTLVQKDITHIKQTLAMQDTWQQTEMQTLQQDLKVNHDQFQQQLQELKATFQMNMQVQLFTICPPTQPCRGSTF